MTTSKSAPYWKSLFLLSVTQCGKAEGKTRNSLIGSNPITLWVKHWLFFAVWRQVYVQSSRRLIFGVWWQLSAYGSVYASGPLTCSEFPQRWGTNSSTFPTSWIFPGWMFSCNILSCICSLSHRSYIDNCRQFCDNLIKKAVQLGVYHLVVLLCFLPVIW